MRPTGEEHQTPHSDGYHEDSIEEADGDIDRWVAEQEAAAEDYIQSQIDAEHEAIERWVAEQEAAAEDYIQSQIDAEHEAIERWVAEQEAAAEDHIQSQIDAEHEASDSWLAEQYESSFQEYTSIESDRSILPVDRIYNHVSVKIRSINENIEAIVEQIKSDIESLCDGNVWSILENTINSPEFQSAYEVSQYTLGERQLFVRHDYVHALLVTLYSLKITNLLFDIERARNLFKYSSDISKAQLVVALGSLWHDCGNAIDRESHQLMSIEIARPYIEAQLEESSVENSGVVLLDSLRAIQYHTKDSGQCLDMESVVVRLADGIDCTSIRCGESGEQPPRALINTYQLNHIAGKAGIDEVDLSIHISTESILICYILDPAFIPPAGVWVSPSMFELERLKASKLRSLGSQYSGFFIISCRIADTDEIYDL